MNTLKARASEHVDDALAAAGGCAVSYGVWQIHGPSGWIIAGVLLIAAAFILAKR